MRRRRRCCRRSRRWRGREEADVCVIGGGYTGLSAALHLAEAGMRVVLLEAQRVGWGASGRNGGQVGSGQRRDQDWLEARFGTAGRGRSGTWPRRRRRWCGGWWRGTRIACDLRPGVISAACRAGEVAGYHAEAEKLARDYGYGEVEPLDRAGIEAMLGTRAYHGGRARPRGGASASAELCARAGAGGGGGGGADLRGEPGGGGGAGRGADRGGAGAGAVRRRGGERLSRRAGAGGGGAGDADQQLHRGDGAARGGAGAAR